MIGAECIFAGDEYFYTHLQFGTLIVGTLTRSVSLGHDGNSPPRISPVMRIPATHQYPVVTSPAVAPVSLSLIGIGSHLWVG